METDKADYMEYVSVTLAFMRRLEAQLLKPHWIDGSHEKPSLSFLKFRDAYVEDLYDAIQDLDVGVYEDGGVLVSA